MIDFRRNDIASAEVDWKYLLCSVLDLLEEVVSFLVS
jgi:hypothetical protein